MKKASRVTRQSVLITSVIALLSSAPPAAGCGSETPTSKNAGDTTRDLAWIKAAHPIYFALFRQGIFRLELNSNSPTPLVIHKNGSVTDLEMSPSGRYLVYRADDRIGGSTYIYDLNHALERQVLGIPKYLHITVSPDDRFLTAMPRPGEPNIVTIVNLNSGKTKQVAIPSIGEKAMVFGEKWSSENNPLFQAREGSNVTFLSFFPDTDEFMQVKGIPVDPLNMAYFDGAKQIQIVCQSCSTHRNFSTADVAGGTVVATHFSLVFHKTGMPDREIAMLPLPPPPVPGQPTLACGPPGIQLRDIFDDRYLLFSVDNAMELYDIEENRTAVLPIPPYIPIVWR